MGIGKVKYIFSKKLQILKSWVDGGGSENIFQAALKKYLNSLVYSYKRLLSN